MAAALLLRLQALVASCFFGSASAPASLPDNDDILREILIHLPNLPSSLHRASLVCKRWRGILSDPAFLRHFCTHHRTTPPLLGFFNGPVFTPLLHAPDRIPRKRFSMPQQPRHGGRLSICSVRHGLVLFLNESRLQAIVWDPITRFRKTIPFAPEFRVGSGDESNDTNHGAVLRTTDYDGDGRGCFKVVLTRTEKRSGDGGGHTTASVFMAVYESATGKWSRTSSTVIPSSHSLLSNVLVGNALCGFRHWSTGILEFDLDTNTVGVIQKPNSVPSSDDGLFRVVRTEDGGLGLAKLSDTGIELWGRTTHGAADAGSGWVLHKTVDMDKLLFPLLPTRSIRVDESDFVPRMVGYDEDNNVRGAKVSTRYACQDEEIPS
ncbi:hypothetical protein EJB05_35119 [Eragrostis curvula]|uniref:Uncharacterized protein n=1 Tax=Eragrostis curvula TaxID=38414 RepID=A0A5J9U5Z2_9POAL|nr:hypothetical protein EJB05_35119 [Eragrostis curvula]